MAIAPGVSLYSKVRGEQTSASEPVAASVDSAEEEKRKHTTYCNTSTS
jgi:hypothetical protein